MAVFITFIVDRKFTIYIMDIDFGFSNKNHHVYCIINWMIIMFAVSSFE